MNILISKSNNIHPLIAAFNMLLLSFIIVALFLFVVSRIGVALDFSFVLPFKGRLLDGYLMTVKLSAASLLLSLMIGIVCAVLQSSKILLLRYFSIVYVTLIRGTPLIMQIYLFFYIVSTAVGIESRFIAGVLILSIFQGAYIAEIIRGSLLSMDATQLEAAKSVGFTKRQITTLIILPQLTARTLPALTGQFASLIKDSSLLSVIAIIELTQTMREISALNLNLLGCFLFLGVLYLSLTLPISYISKRLEQRFSYET
jgi:polar amino acid transport system permease protein